MASPSQLHLKQDGLHAGQAGSLEDFSIRHVVLPFNAKDGAKAALVEPLKQPDLLPIENPGLCTVQEKWNDDCSVYLDLCGEAERVTLPYSLWQSFKGTAGFTPAVVRILADCGIIGDDASQVSKMFHCVQIGVIDSRGRGWYKTSVFFSVMVRPKFWLHQRSG